MNGATIRDAAGNDAVLTLPVPGATGSLSANKDIVIDTRRRGAEHAGPPGVERQRDVEHGQCHGITTPTFDIPGVESGATVTLTLVPIGGGEPIVVQAQVAAGHSSCTITVTSPLSPGVYTVTARQAELRGTARDLSSGSMAPRCIDNVAAGIAASASVGTFVGGFETTAPAVST